MRKQISSPNWSALAAICGRRAVADVKLPCAGRRGGLAQQSMISRLGRGVLAQLVARYLGVHVRMSHVRTTSQRLKSCMNADFCLDSGQVIDAAAASLPGICGGCWGSTSAAAAAAGLRRARRGMSRASQLGAIIKGKEW
jgi:hypothetical protein